jgi:hypothetical protein
MRQSSMPSGPVQPAASPSAALNAGASQNVQLRSAGFVAAALGILVLAATSAVYRCAAAWLGAWQALPLSLAVGAWLVLRASAVMGSRPAALQVGAYGLSAWDKSERLLMQGRIAGCSQWSDRLLVFIVKPEHGRSRTLLLAADSMPRTAFRGLAVLGRRAAGT